MSLFKRNKTWWTDFSVNGVRFRMSLDTTDWRDAETKQKEKIAEAMLGKIVPTSQQFSRLAFTQAAERYLDGRKLELSERSMKKERQLLLKPCKFFSVTPLVKITAESLLAYRESRAKDGLSPAYINMEMGTIRRILKRAKRWHIVADEIKPLKERREVGRALSPELKAKLLAMAGSRPEWQAVRCAIVLALNTTMRGCELKGLRWRDVDLLDRMLTIRRSKTEAGERVIPLNREALGAIIELYRRSQAKKINEPDHYVFAACENLRFDATRPQASWRTAWRHLTRAIRCPACALLQDPADNCRNDECRADIHKVKSPFAGLRFHDLRHHAITELAESQASEQTIMAIAGHVSPKMLAHYSHVRLEAKRRALDALTSGSTEAGHATRHDTNAPPAAIPHPQVIERSGRPVGARTPDLYRVKVTL